MTARSSRQSPRTQQTGADAALLAFLIGALAIGAFAAGAIFNEWWTKAKRRHTLRSIRQGGTVIRFPSPPASEESPQENV